MSGQTKEERFMVHLYEVAEQKGDTTLPCSRYQVGELMGLRTKSVDTICKILLQANFIKKAGEEEVVLTSRGIDLAQSLIS